MSTTSDLIGLKLDGYSIKRLIEVYSVDEDGLKNSTIDFFNDEKIAVAWAQGQTDPHFCKTGEVLVITNDERYFLFEGEEIGVHDNEQAALEVRQRALAKLSLEERTVLGL